MKSPILLLVAGLTVALSTINAADPPEVVTVVADGTGTTIEEATKDAIRNAVRQVVGVLIDAETQVKNDEVIADKVIALSNGFVKKFEKVSEKKEGGLIRVKIKAQVEKGQVTASLKAAKVITTAVDGESLAAEKMTKEEVKKNAVALLTKEIASFPKAYQAAVVGKVQLDKTGVVAQIAFGVDKEKYLKAAKSMTDVLDKAASSKSAAVLRGNAGSGQFTADPRARELVRLRGDKPKDVAFIHVMVGANENLTSLRWQSYALDAEIVKSIATAIDTRVIVTCQLKGKGGAVVDESKFEYSAGGREWERWGLPTMEMHGDLFISPFIIKAHSQQSIGFSTFITEYSPVMSEKLQFNITDQELKQVTSADCEVVSKKDEKR